MAKLCGTYEAAAVTEVFEFNARRLQALVLLDRNESGQGALAASIMMGPYTQTRLPIAPAAMAEIRATTGAVAKAATYGPDAKARRH